MPTRKQGNTEAEKAAIKAGKPARQMGPDKANRAAQKDVNGRQLRYVGDMDNTAADVWADTGESKREQGY